MKHSERLEIFEKVRAEHSVFLLSVLWKLTGELLDKIKKDNGDPRTMLKQTADGKYPSSLTGMTVIKEFVEAMRAKFAGQELGEEQTREARGKILTLQMIGITYGAMIQDGNEPAYYGDKVTAEFPHAVLMRWKMADNRYRVVFDDVRIYS